MVPMFSKESNSYELSNLDATNIKETTNELLAIVKMCLGIMTVCERCHFYIFG
jgi:hypothetical protein